MKVHGCNSLHERKGPPPTQLRPRLLAGAEAGWGGLPVRLKQELEKRHGSGLEMGLRIVLVFYHCCREFSGWGNRVGMALVVWNKC